LCISEKNTILENLVPIWLWADSLRHWFVMGLKCLSLKQWRRNVMNRPLTWWQNS